MHSWRQRHSNRRRPTNEQIIRTIRIDGEREKRIKTLSGGNTHTQSQPPLLFPSSQYLKVTRPTQKNKQSKHTSRVRVLNSFRQYFNNNDCSPIALPGRFGTRTGNSNTTANAGRVVTVETFAVGTVGIGDIRSTAITAVLTMTMTMTNAERGMWCQQLEFMAIHCLSYCESVHEPSHSRTSC